MLINKGCIYQLGEHKLACGDSTNSKLIGELVENFKVSCIVTDPPYGVSYVESSFQQSGKHKKIINDHKQTSVEYAQFTVDWLEPIKPYLTKKNTCYIFNSDKMLFALKDGMDQADFRFTQLLIWIKNHAVVGRMDYLPQHELIVYGWYGKHQFYKAKDKSIIFYPKPNKSSLHPTMKPVGLLRRLILNSTQINDVVYEPFAGSGSTLLACEQTKRKCLAVELDPEYCQVIINRWQKLTNKEVIQVKSQNEQ